MAQRGKGEKLRIVVIGGIFGCEIITKYIREELPANVEMVVVPGVSEEDYGAVWVRRVAIEIIEPYIGADVIVLADSMLALEAADILRRKYPEQKFVGYGWRLKDAAVHGEKKTMLLATERAKRSVVYQRAKAAYQGIALYEPECQKWINLRAEEVDEAIRAEIGEFVGGRIVIYSPEILEMVENLERVFGWKAEVIELKQPLIYDICVALGLRGLDGTQSRDRGYRVTGGAVEVL